MKYLLEENYEEAVRSRDGLLFFCQYLLRPAIKSTLQYCVNYGNIFLYHSVRLFGSSLKRNSHSLINLEYSKKGILPVKHDFVNLGQAVAWENPPQTKEEALELLQEFFLIALDVFREIPYTEDTLN